MRHEWVTKCGMIKNNPIESLKSSGIRAKMSMHVAPTRRAYLKSLRQREHSMTHEYGRKMGIRYTLIKVMFYKYCPGLPTPPPTLAANYQTRTERCRPHSRWDWTSTPGSCRWRGSGVNLSGIVNICYKEKVEGENELLTLSTGTFFDPRTGMLSV